MMFHLRPLVLFVAMGSLGDDGKLKPEYRTPDNPTGEPQLTIPDLPEEYRNAWKYSPKQQIGEGEEFMDNKKIIPKDNLGRETPV